jgi:hypothetical protein
MAAAAGTGVKVDTSDLERGARQLRQASGQLASPADPHMRGAASTAGEMLTRQLRASAMVAATPQARIVVESAQLAGFGEVGVSLGGGRGVGSRGTPAGAILWGSESGGRNFDAPRGGSYWIRPAVDRTRDWAASAGGPYLAATNSILRGVA